jgi:hemolysin activation/secretion protein
MAFVPFVARAESTFYLKKLVIADTVETAAEASATDEGAQVIVVHEIPLFATPEFAKEANELIGKVIDSTLLNSLVSKIVQFAQTHGYPDAQVVVPNKQDISAGTLRLAVILSPKEQPSLATSTETYYLKKIAISDTVEKAAALPDNAGDTSPVFVEDVAFLAAPEFARSLNQFIGRPINNQLLRELINSVSQYARTHDRVIARVAVPERQNISSGTLRLAVLVGRYKQLSYRGNKWFSQKLLEQKLGIRPGDEVRQSVLEDAVNWANTNPFRQIKVVIDNLANDPGKADLIVAVEDARPIRSGIAYNNDGVPVIGRNQYSGSIQFGNLWGADHQGSYQFITTDNSRLFQAHIVDYLVPLPWRHYITFGASYIKVKPSLFGGLVDQKGEDFSSNIRYKIPVSRGAVNGEAFAGLDFKASNNNLEYGGFDVSAAKIHIFDFVSGITAVRRDAQGAWQLGASITFSPGNIDAKNTDASFQPGYIGNVYHVGRLGARARYATLSLSVQRLLKLSKGWEFFARANAQIASGNLVANEQLTVGGANTVRGFNPNVLSGEFGYVLNADLQSPVWTHTLSFLPKNSNRLTARGTIFYDAAQVFYKQHFPTVNGFGQQVGWDDDVLRPIASTGVGLRLSIAKNFSLNFDYGWQVTHPAAPATDHGRGHIKVALAF